MRSLFEEARERVPAIEAARFYGVDFDRKNWALCPFHNDKHASMSFKAGRYRCWSCEAHGDSVDFVKRLFGLSAMDALQRLNSDFALDLPIGKPASPKQKAEARRQREIAKAHKKFEEWRKNLLSNLAAAYRVGFLALKSERTPDQYSAQEAYSVRFSAIFEYLMDTLSDGSPEEQYQIFMERRGITRWIEQVLPNSTIKADFEVK